MIVKINLYQLVECLKIRNEIPKDFELKNAIIGFDHLLQLKLESIYSFGLYVPYNPHMPEIGEQILEIDFLKGEKR